MKAGIDVLEKLERKEIEVKDAAEKAIKQPNLLNEVYKGVHSANTRIRYSCAKILRIISEEKPQMLYPRMNFFIELLDSDKRILQWDALYVIANLTRADTENRFDAIFDKYYSFLDAEYMITVANVVVNSGKIAKAKLHLTEKITNEILKTENLTTKPHLTQECKNIIVGHAISALSTYFNQIENKEAVISFVKRQLNNSRSATRARAEKFLRSLK